MKTEPALNDDFTGKPLASSFSFTDTTNPLSTPFSELPIKQEILDGFGADVKPNLQLEEQAIKEEMDMKEQDNAVAALLKQEEEEAKVNEYIKNDEKSSVLLFDEFDHHIKEETAKNSSSDFLLTPESYNVALHSVVASNK